MSNKNNFLQLIQSKIGCGYVLGSQGQIMTDKLLNVLKYNYPKDRVDANYKVALKWIGQICFDCSGLVIWTLQQLNILTSNQDYSASGIYSNLCTPIKKEELKAGDLVFVNGSKVDGSFELKKHDTVLIKIEKINYGIESKITFKSE